MDLESLGVQIDEDALKPKTEITLVLKTGGAFSFTTPLSAEDFDTLFWSTKKRTLKVPVDLTAFVVIKKRDVSVYHAAPLNNGEDEQA